MKKLLPDYIFELRDMLEPERQKQLRPVADQLKKIINRFRPSGHASFYHHSHGALAGIWGESYYINIRFHDDGEDFYFVVTMRYQEGKKQIVNEYIRFHKASHFNDCLDAFKRKMKAIKAPGCSTI